MNPKHMDPIEDVIFLGAGASHADGAPLQNNLIQEFADFLRSKPKTKIRLGDFTLPQDFDFSDDREQSKLIKEYFDYFWGIDISSDTQREIFYPSFEECLGILDVADNRNENFTFRRKGDVKKTRYGLIFLIAKAIARKLENSSSNYHHELVKRLKESNKLKSTAFVSLNYDIIIDNILLNLRETDGIDLDYGIDFMNFEWPPDQNSDPWSRPNPGSFVYLLKIHGSLNWLYCSTCNQVAITPKKKGAMMVFTKSEPCKNCEMPMEPIIIPPTYFKDMNNIFIQQIFQKTDKILRNAKNIYLCGYSLPDADMHVKYLLKRAELLNSNLSNIYIINNHDSKTNQGDEKQKFLQFFKNKEKVHYTSLKFEDFCKNGISSDR